MISHCIFIQSTSFSEKLQENSDRYMANNDTVCLSKSSHKVYILLKIIMWPASLRPAVPPFFQGFKHLFIHFKFSLSGGYKNGFFKRKCYNIQTTSFPGSPPVSDLGRSSGRASGVLLDSPSSIERVSL
jgi:hypothetical protein